MTRISTFAAGPAVVGVALYLESAGRWNRSGRGAAGLRDSRSGTVSAPLRTGGGRPAGGRSSMSRRSVAGLSRHRAARLPVFARRAATAPAPAASGTTWPSWGSSRRRQLP